LGKGLEVVSGSPETAGAVEVIQYSPQSRPDESLAGFFVRWLPDATVDQAGGGRYEQYHYYSTAIGKCEVIIHQIDEVLK